MKITCDSFELSEKCQIAQHAASTKTTIPATEGILLIAAQNRVKIIGYDLEMGITTEIGALVEEEGRIVLNARTLAETLRKLPGSRVSIECDARNIAVIKSENFKSTLIGMSANDYPELPLIQGGYNVSFDKKLMKDMIRKTIFCAAVKDVRIVHTGVKYEIENNQIKMIAVDGVRLAVRTENVNYDGEPLSFVVPAKTLSEVLKLLDDEEENVDISVGQRHIIFNVNEYSIISRLLEGEFLNYKAALPSTYSTKAIVDTNEILDCVERISLIITDKIKSPVKAVFSEDKVEMSVVTNLGTANDTICSKTEGNNCTIGFNNKYLIDALRACDEDEIKILLSGPVSPILIEPVDSDKYIFLILPVRLKNED